MAKLAPPEKRPGPVDAAAFCSGAGVTCLAKLFGLEWAAYNDAIRLGSTRVRIYRIEAKLPGERVITILVSRVGEILQVTFPGQLEFTNENFPLQKASSK